MSHNGTYKLSTMSTFTGTKHDLPEHVRQVAGLRGEVIAWTQLDPDLEPKIGRYACLRTFGPLLCLPPFWIYLLFIWPCLCGLAKKEANAARSQYWIITEQELRIVSLDHDACCIPGTIKFGVNVKTVPLENITVAGLDAIGTGCMNKCAVDLPTIYIDTASQNGKGHEATGLALANYESFVRQILDSRDAYKAGHRSAPTAMSMQGVGDIGNTSGKSSAERIAESAQLRDAGVLS
jgi:hypothetical protein